MLHNIDLLKLRNAELVQFDTDVIDLTAKADPKKLGIEVPFNALAGHLPKLNAAFKIEQGSIITKTIEDLDDARDQLLTGIFILVDGYTYHPNPTVAQQAVVVKRNIDMYGRSVIRASLQAETASIENIINDWENKPELMAAAATLQLADWKDALKTTNNALKDAYQNRVVATATTVPIPTIKELKPENVLLWKKLCNRIDGQYYTNEDTPANAEPYLLLINQINTLIDKYAVLIAQRKTKPKPPTP